MMRTGAAHDEEKVASLQLLPEDTMALDFAGDEAVTGKLSIYLTISQSMHMVMYYIHLK